MYIGMKYMYNAHTFRFVDIPLKLTKPLQNLQNVFVRALYDGRDE